MSFIKEFILTLFHIPEYSDVVTLVVFSSKATVCDNSIIWNNSINNQLDATIAIC